VETELIDVALLRLPTDDAGEAIKDSGYSARMERADALIIVAPEYNHGYSGLLKHVLDSCLKEYIHKAVGIVGVSAGPFGGARMIQNLLPVMRELGLVTIFWDVNFSSVQKVFDKDGLLLDEAFIGRIDKFLKELIWMAKTMRHGREQIALD
jgi:NAD(P)H-dependent FMN reductase